MIPIPPYIINYLSLNTEAEGLGTIIGTIMGLVIGISLGIFLYWDEIKIKIKNMKKKQNKQIYDNKPTTGSKTTKKRNKS